MQRQLPLLLLLFISFSFSISLKSQIFQDQCNPDTIVVDTSGVEINWQQFPDFDLPFTIVYHGIAPADSIAYPLKKGFSHIAVRGTYFKDTIYPDQRAYTWTGIANADNWAQTTHQPWRMIKSPWGNDIEGYREKWNHRLQNAVLTNWYKYHPPEGEERVDIVIADLEWAHHSDAGILSIKNDTLVPEYYRLLPDEKFIAEYKKAMSLLYAEPLKLARDSLHESVSITSYAELPIRRTWYDIDDTTWQGWLGDSSKVDYLMEDTAGFMNSEFYNLHDIICPSVYYFYDLDSLEIGKKYLAYNLFQSEANAIWSDKEQLVYCWLNYTSNYYGVPVQPWVAEATAIFPLMSGAMGLYPWKPHLPDGYDSYEYFVKGLFRLSQFNEFFDGNGIYITPTPARESFVNEQPLWRGIVQGNEMLVASHNPFASPTDTTYIPLNYGTWSDTLGLIGTEVFLCKLTMTFVGMDEQNPIDEIVVYPNPSHGVVNISSSEAIQDIYLIDLSGKRILIPNNNSTENKIDLTGFAEGIYILELHTAERAYFKKIIKN